MRDPGDGFALLFGVDAPGPAIPMQEFPEVLEDGNLTLRPPAQADLPGLTRRLNDSRVAAI